MGSIYKKRPTDKRWTIAWFDAAGLRRARVSGRDRRLAMRDLAQVEAEVEHQRAGLAAAPPETIEHLRRENAELRRQVARLTGEIEQLRRQQEQVA